MLLIYFLIVFFVSLFIYQIILAFYPNSIIEGMETKDKDKDKGKKYEEYPTDPLILGKQNAGNIEYLKGQLDNLSSTTTDINQMETTISSLQDQVNELSNQMSQLSQSMISNEPPDISGATSYNGDTTTDDATDDISQQ
jgi:hypothetical protein